MEELVEQFLSLRGRESIERIAGSVGKGASKSQKFLELHGGVQSELIGGSRFRCSVPSGLRSDRKTLVARCHPNGNFRAIRRRFTSGQRSCCCRRCWPGHVWNNRCR